jgi:hypothetical protein
MNEVVVYGINLLVGGLAGYMIKKIRTVNQENEAIKTGMQAMLRDRMIQTYNHYYYDKGYMPIYAKQSFENVYNAYHNLGLNGVMDDIKRKVMALPTEPDGDDVNA